MEKPQDKPKAVAEVKGLASYKLKAPHYRDGVMYETGAVITVCDEKPSKKWQRVALDKKAPVLAKRLTPKEAALLAPEAEEPLEELSATAPAPNAPAATDKKRPNEKSI